MAAVLIQKYLQYTTAPSERSKIDRLLRSFTLLTAPVSSNWRDLSLRASWRSAERRELTAPQDINTGSASNYPEAFTLSSSLLDTRLTGSLTPWKWVHEKFWFNSNLLLERFFFTFSSLVSHCSRGCIQTILQRKTVKYMFILDCIKYDKTDELILIKIRH